MPRWLPPLPDLAAISQGHTLESPGGLIHPSGAMPLQFPPDLSAPSLTVRTESGVVDWQRPYGSLDPPFKSVTRCNYFGTTGGVLGPSASFASAGGSTLDSGFGVSVFGVDGSVSVASPCHLMGIPDEISVMPDDDSLPRPHPLTLCPSSPSLTAASTFESTACLTSGRVGEQREPSHHHFSAFVLWKPCN